MPSGVWAILQVNAVPSGGTLSQIKGAIANQGVVGLGLRIPANLLFPTQNTFDPSILNSGYSTATAVGKLFKPRIIYGQYTPSWVGSPMFSDANGSGPMPFLAGGAPNTAFESFYRFANQSVVNWALDKNATKPGSVAEIDDGWYSLNYSELYYGPGVQGAYGSSTSSTTQWALAAHVRLVDIALAAAGGQIGIGFGLSGHGPIGAISAGLAAHMATVPSGLVFMQANGWDQTGEWGGPLESTLDASVWSKVVLRGLQDISPTAARTPANWDTMFAAATNLPGGSATYLEIYVYQFASGQFNTATGLTSMLDHIRTWQPAA